MLKLVDIYKSFGDKKVLKGISLEIKEGEVYGLIGANGAGKTTLFNIVARILDADSGKVFVGDKEIKIANDLKGNIGYILDIPAMYEYMTAYEYLEYIASPMKLPKDKLRSKSDAVLTEVGLGDVGDKRIKSFSRGMKQRMGIAAGLISDPAIILMDEPSSALDPLGRLDVIKIIDSLRAKGKTIILSTHILSDVERVCDRVGLLVEGKIVVEGKLRDVLDRYSYDIFNVYVSKEDFDQVIAKAKTCKYFVSAKKCGDHVEIEYLGEGKKTMFKCLSSVAVNCDGVMKKEPTIEQVFLLASNEVKNV